MWIFNFWMFRVWGAIITIYLFVKLLENSSFETSTLGGLAIPFALPLIALFWINLPKLFYNRETPQVRKLKTKSKTNRRDKKFTINYLNKKTKKKIK